MTCIALAILTIAPKGNPAQQLVEALGNLKSVSYRFERICDYPSSSYHHELSSEVYLERGSYPLTGARF
jgi:outer membrane lipoprotein-sorting protein